MFIKTGELPFRIWLGSIFEAQSKLNEGKFDFSEDGYLILKATGEPPTELWGYPFPTIDPKDISAAQKIMENHEARRCRTAASSSNAQVNFVGRGGFERNLIACGDYFYYFNRFFKKDSVPNPNHMLKQDRTFVAFPYDLRGTATMSWHYQDERESSSFAYLPMLRRVRRTSAAARSDPFMGSDACTDDADGYGGKNADMRWRLLEEKKTILAGFTSLEPLFFQRAADGSSRRACNVGTNGGWEEPGWQGAPWAPIEVTWCPRDVYVIEIKPKDKYYNYGIQHYYVDSEAFLGYFKGGIALLCG